MSGQDGIPDEVRNFWNRYKLVWVAGFDKICLMLTSLRFNISGQGADESSERSAWRTNLSLVFPDIFHAGICTGAAIARMASAETTMVGFLERPRLLKVGST
jgi:hypothetical protein